MAPYQITIAYDGSEFLGFQRQANGRTVQGEIEKSLANLGWKEDAIMYSGRTDSGVHAEGQVVAFNMDWSHNVQDLLKAINDNLPQDIAAVSVKLVSEDFHPRYNAKMRVYRYQIYIGNTHNPLLDRYNWRVWPALDQHLMKKGADMVKGTYNFQAFGKPPSEGMTTVRTIRDSEWKTIDKDRFHYTISSQAFLYHMVRRIVYLLVRIGQAKLDAVVLKESLQGNNFLPAGIAPANGLFLEKVIY